MSKTLILVRHAKSSWEVATLRDHERPLLPTGINRTNRVASYLMNEGVSPDLIISSHAVRAFETAKILADKLGYPHHEIQIESNIYYFDTEGLMDLTMALPDTKDVVFMVGHNPSMTQFANMFLEEKLDYLPTTGVVSVSFETEQWFQTPMAARRLNFYVSPKMLKS